jgi:hypothetical protein
VFFASSRATCTATAAQRSTLQVSGASTHLHCARAHLGLLRQLRLPQLRLEFCNI